MSPSKMVNDRIELLKFTFEFGKLASEDFWLAGLNMSNPVIFDIGCHKGQDADFYLKKGFTVVAVEASPALCESLKRRFSDQIANDHFILVEKAIAEKEGEVEFFVNDKVSVWGTIRPEWAKRNENAGASSTVIRVPSVNFATLIEQYGVPYFLKIDIEGADLLCLEGLLPLKSVRGLFRWKSSTGRSCSKRWAFSRGWATRSFA